MPDSGQSDNYKVTTCAKVILLSLITAVLFVNKNKSSTFFIFILGNVYSMETGDSTADSRMTMYSENWFTPKRGQYYVEFKVDKPKNEIQI